jgi:hypothetical protein
LKKPVRTGCPIQKEGWFPELSLTSAVVTDATEEPVMANERIPNDPYRVPNPADDPYRTYRRDDDMGDPARLDSQLQMDPELAEGPASSGRIALFAIGIAVVLGAVFYGLNSSSINQASTAPPATTAQNAPATSPPAAPPGMRDVTPRTNSDPGMTTGSASNTKPLTPADPKAPPAPAQAPANGTR